MAEAFRDSDGRRILRPRIASIQLRDRERALFETADDLPNWKLADKSRRILVDVNRDFSAGLPPRPPDMPTEKLDPKMLREAAAISTAAITIRAVGSGLSLVSCGCVFESGQALRRAQEARLHAQAVRDDASGRYAVRFLEGKSSGLSKLAQRYKVQPDIDLLSRLAHADVHGLHLLGFARDSRGPGSIAIDTRPNRDDHQAGAALYLLAQASLEMLRILSQIFDVDVEVPPWVSAEVERINRETQAERDAAAEQTRE
jgi:hypothetical protein